MAARIIDVVKNSHAPGFAGIIYDDIAKAENTLEDRSGDRDILDLAKRDIPRRPRNQTIVNLNLRVGHRVTNHVSLEMVIRGDQKQTQSNRQPEIPGNVNELNHREENRQCDSAQDRRRVPEFYEHQCRSRSENDVLDIIIRVLRTHRDDSLWPSNPGFF